MKMHVQFYSNKQVTYYGQMGFEIFFAIWFVNEGEKPFYFEFSLKHEKKLVKVLIFLSRYNFLIFLSRYIILSRLIFSVTCLLTLHCLVYWMSDDVCGDVL